MMCLHRRPAVPGITRAIQDGLILIVFGIITIFVALYLDAFEALNTSVASYEFWEIDEILFTILVCSIGIGIFAFRRWTDLKKEINDRIVIEERLKRAIRGGALGIWDWNVKTGEVVLLSAHEGGTEESFREERVPVAEVRLHVHPEDYPALLQRMNGTLEKKYLDYETKCRVRGDDGTWRWVHVRGRAVTLGEDDSPACIVGILQDITALKQTQDALVEANKKNSLLSSITRHDIINQVGAISAYAHLLSDDLPDEGLERRYLRQIMAATETIKDQIVFMRDYQSMGAKSPEYCCVSTVVRCAYQTVSHAGNEIEISVSTGPLEIFADPMLEKVFFNLMDNTIRHGEDATWIRVSFHEDEGTGVLVYEDNGEGIPPSLKEQIFTRGYGRNSGLGLFLVREILGITGMTIRETGTEGEGARFEILVPAGNFRTGRE